MTVSAMCVQRRGSLQGHTGAVTKQSRWSAATPPGWARTARPTSGCAASCGHEACGGQQVTGVRNASSTVAEAGGGEALAGGSVEAAGGGAVPVGFARTAGGPWELARATATYAFPFKLFRTLSIPHSGHWGAAPHSWCQQAQDVTPFHTEDRKRVTLTERVTVTERWRHCATVPAAKRAVRGPLTRCGARPASGLAPSRGGGRRAHLLASGSRRGASWAPGRLVPRQQSGREQLSYLQDSGGDTMQVTGSAFQTLKSPLLVSEFIVHIYMYLL